MKLRLYHLLGVPILNVTFAQYERGPLMQDFSLKSPRYFSAYCFLVFLKHVLPKCLVFFFLTAFLQTVTFRELIAPLPSYTNLQTPVYPKSLIIQENFSVGFHF